MTEKGKTQAACCKAWLIECEPHVVRHPATQQKQLDLGLRVTLAGLKKETLSISLQLTPIQLTFSLHITQLSPVTINTSLHFMGQGVNLFNYATDSSILL